MDSKLGTTDDAPEDESPVEVVAPEHRAEQPDYSDYSDTESELSFSDCVYYPDELEALQRELDEECILAIECPEESKQAKWFVEDESVPEDPTPPPTAAPAVPAAPVTPADPVGPARRDVDSDEEERPGICSLPIPNVFYGPYRIFFDMEIDGCFIGRIIIKLGKQFPLCRNHIDKLCTGKMRPRGDLTMHYTGTRIHRVSPDEFIEGGILRPLVPEFFEPMYIPNDFVWNPQYYDSYIMVAKKEINDECGGARFFFTTTNFVKHCDPEHVPIGCVTWGMDVIDQIASCPTNENGIFTNTITIGHCGSINMLDDDKYTDSRVEKKQRMSTFMRKMQERKEIPAKRWCVLDRCNPDREERARLEKEAKAEQDPKDIPSTSSSSQ